MNSQIRHEHSMDYMGHNGYESVYYCPICQIVEIQTEECL